ncbi:MAG: glycoside hydrolase family 32 protein [Clostridia bacterium]|nr:glycoside hydrolase family 32 protein [Clostridia bacterium]
MLPRFHYRPRRNWINDPNGLCFAGGWYHLYYQYNPTGCRWGNIHWGHARSRDMLRWETLPPALAPDHNGGEEHCFSGCCCMDAQGQPHFFYTSIGAEEAGRGPRDGAEQWLALPDPDMNTLRRTACVLQADAHPGFVPTDWRDPCVIPWQDGFLMALGGAVDGCGCVLAYTSPDMADWTYRGVIARSDTADGIPWECPNLFRLRDKTVLIFSPCAEPVYIVGDMDDHFRLQPIHQGVLDPGGHRGFYAPQTFQDGQGRRILMGWMPETCSDAETGAKGWSGVMSLPRQLILAPDGDLRAIPLPEIASLMENQRGLMLPPGDHRLTDNGRSSILRVDIVLEDKPLVIDLPGGAHITLTPDHVLTLTGAGEPIRRTVPMTGTAAGMFLACDEGCVECMVCGAWLSARLNPANDADASLSLHTPVFCEAVLCDSLAPVDQQF